MSAADPPRIVAAIGGQDQRAAMIAAGEQVAAAVSAALSLDWPVRLRLIGLDDPEVPPGVVLVAAPLADLADPASDAEVEARWTARIARWRAAGHDRVVLCNLFRGADGAEGIERIRRLNHLAIGLSRRYGVEIVDVDRLVALCGARTIAAAPQGADTAMAQLVGHAIADAILQGDLGGVLDEQVQARASAIHGHGRDIPRLLSRFLIAGGPA